MPSAFAKGQSSFAAAGSMVLCLILVVPASTAFAAQSYTETWSVASSLQGWDTLNGDVTPAWDNTRDATGALGFTGSDAYATDWIFADTGASGGAFVGDLITAGAVQYAFDLWLDSGSDDVSQWFLELFDGGTGEQWQSELLVAPALDDWTGYTVSLDESSGGWTYVAGSQNDFSYLLANVTDVSLVLSEGSGSDGVGVAGALDDFRLMTAADIPEPGTVALFGLGLLGLAVWRRRRG